MRSFTLPLRCVLLVVALATSASLLAQPHGYSINSRGDSTVDSEVFALWRINLATGEETYIGWTGREDFVDIEGIAFNAEGNLYGADDSTHTLVRIGTATGNAIPVGGSRSNMGVPLGTSMDFGMTFTCDDRLLVSSAGTHELFEGDIESGRLEVIGDMGLPIVDLASIGNVIFGIGLGSDDSGSPVIPNLYRVDPETATVELIGPLGDAVSPYNQAGLAADEEGRLWAITDRNRVFGERDTEANPSQILLIDPDTGQAQVMAETITGIESLAISSPLSCDARSGHFGQAHAIPVLSDTMRFVLMLSLLLLAGLRLRAVQS